MSESDSVIRARDSNIVVIGGLMKTEAGAPAATDARNGIASRVGRSDSRDGALSKKELIVLLRPTVAMDKVDRTGVSIDSANPDGASPARSGRQQQGAR